MYYFDVWYFIFLAPALLLAMWAQMRVRTTYAEARQVPAPMTGAQAARRILDSAGLHNVEINAVPGELTDHYDPSRRVLNLSGPVYQGRSMAAVGIAAHEAGHALQHAVNYAPLVVRNAAVPAASFGSGVSVVLIMIGALVAALHWLVWAGILLFGAVVFFQVVNLPVEFNASGRAKEQLLSLGVIDQRGLVYVKRVLDAAAWTYVAATLQTILTLLYFIMRFTGDRRGDDEPA